MHISISPGEAGKPFFTDPEGKPLERVSINVYDGKNWKGFLPNERDKAYTGLRISASYPSHLYPGVGCEYKLYNPTKTLIIDQDMPEAYQIHLINTIDTLIPSITNPVTQSDRRVSQELQSPKAFLPSPGRRTPRG